MFFNSLVKTLGSSYNIFNTNGIDNANPNLVKYFRNEYGPNWKTALEHHIYKKNIKNDKKAA